MNIGDDEDEVKDDNKDSGFYCMGCDDFRVELETGRIRMAIL